MHPNILNIADAKAQPEPPERAPSGPNADRYNTRCAPVASRIGARQLGYNLTVGAPGKRSCPFHSHRAQEEMFFTPEGAGELRYGDARHPLRAGDIIACPAGGPETAYQVINTGVKEMRCLSLSTLAPVGICEYPDSGRFGVFEALPDDADGRHARFRHVGPPEDARDYWEGE